MPSRLLLDKMDEPETPAMDGLDHALSPPVIAQSLARRLDTAGDGRVRNDPPVPYQADDLVPGDEAIPLGDEHQQQGEHLWFDCHAHAVPPQLERPVIELECIKPE